MHEPGVNLQPPLSNKNKALCEPLDKRCKVTRQGVPAMWIPQRYAQLFVWLHESMTCVVEVLFQFVRMQVTMCVCMDILSCRAMQGWELNPEEWHREAVLREAAALDRWKAGGQATFHLNNATHQQRKAYKRQRCT